MSSTAKPLKALCSNMTISSRGRGGELLRPRRVVEIGRPVSGPPPSIGSWSRWWRRGAASCGGTGSRNGSRGPRFASVAKAAARMLATQAQDFHGAKWALALRSTRPDRRRRPRLRAAVRGLADALMFMAATRRPLADDAAGPVLRGERGRVACRRSRRRLRPGRRPAGAASPAGSRWAGRALLQVLERGGVATGGGRGSSSPARTIVFGPPRGTESSLRRLQRVGPVERGLERGGGPR